MKPPILETALAANVDAWARRRAFASLAGWLIAALALADVVRLAFSAVLPAPLLASGIAPLLGPVSVLDAVTWPAFLAAAAVLTVRWLRPAGEVASVVAPVPCWLPCYARTLVAAAAIAGAAWLAALAVMAAWWLFMWLPGSVTYGTDGNWIMVLLLAPFLGAGRVVPTLAAAALGVSPSVADSWRLTRGMTGRMGLILGLALLPVLLLGLAAKAFALDLGRRTGLEGTFAGGFLASTLNDFVLLAGVAVVATTASIAQRHLAATGLAR